MRQKGTDSNRFNQSRLKRLGSVPLLSHILILLFILYKRGDFMTYEEVEEILRFKEKYSISETNEYKAKSKICKFVV